MDLQVQGMVWAILSACGPTREGSVPGFRLPYQWHKLCFAALTSIAGDQAASKGQDLALQAGEAKSMFALTTRGVIFIHLT